MNSLSRMLLLVVATGAMALSIPAVASATDYCVLTSCGGTNVNTLEEALVEAKKRALGLEGPPSSGARPAVQPRRARAPVR